MRRRGLILGGLAIVAAATLLPVTAETATADHLLVGQYDVRGEDSKKGSYEGTVQLSEDETGAIRARGRLRFRRGKDHRFDVAATATDTGITFTHENRIRLSFWDRLFGLFGGGGADEAGTTVYVLDASGTDTAGQLRGVWTVEGSERRTDTWQKAVLGLDSVSPAEVSVGRSDQELVIHGRFLPRSATVDDIVFLAGDAEDASVRVTRVRRTNDDRTELRIEVEVERTATLGPRALRVRDPNAEVAHDGEATLANAITVQPGPPRLRLGHPADRVQAGREHELFVPIEDGTLTFRPAIAELRANDGSVVEGDGESYEIAKAGTFQVIPASDGELTVSYVLEAECAPENKPWHFWYFPYAKRSRAGMSLWSDGGAYEKLDAALGITHDPESAEEFDASRHIDRDEFEMPEDADEAARYITDTTKGFAWCYQRSEDSSKGWWGHCWGAGVASSIYRQPEAATIEGVDGESYSFTQEEVEGLLSSYFTDHSVIPRRFVSDCPAARPTDELEEPCDRFADDFFLGLHQGIGKEGLAIACNLRAELTSEETSAMNQVWNHVIFAYRAEVKEVDGANDKTVVEVSLQIQASNDIYPSRPDSRPREESYVLRFKCNAEGGVSRDDMEHQNWVDASHYTPSYLWKISGTTGRTTKNEVLHDEVGLEKLIEMFGYKKYGEE